MVHNMKQQPWHQAEYWYIYIYICLHLNQFKQIGAEYWPK